MRNEPAGGPNPQNNALRHPIRCPQPAETHPGHPIRDPTTQKKPAGHQVGLSHTCFNRLRVPQISHLGAVRTCPNNFCGVPYLHRTNWGTKTGALPRSQPLWAPKSVPSTRLEPLRAPPPPSTPHSAPPKTPFPTAKVIKPPQRLAAGCRKKAAPYGAALPLSRFTAYTATQTVSQ